MKFSINKNKLAARIFSVLLMVSAFMLITPQISAQGEEDIEFAVPVSGTTA